MDPISLVAAGLAALPDLFDAMSDALDSAGAPDTSGAAGAASVHFGQTVTFPDGSTDTSPYTDSQHQVYPTRTDYLQGTNPHTVDSSGQAWPV